MTTTVTTLKTLDTPFTEVEKVFNDLGHIPVVSYFSGGLRSTFGTMQVGLAVLNGVRLLALSYLNKANKEAYLAESKAQRYYAVHGAMNMARGYIEAWLFVGNVLTIVYDLAAKRFNYGNEPEQIAAIRSTYSRERLNAYLDKSLHERAKSTLMPMAGMLMFGVQSVMATVKA